jgi:hypothetical protein
MIVSVFLALAMLFSFSACSSAKVLKPEDVIKVNLHGTDGDGWVTLTWNYDNVKDIMRKKLGTKYEPTYHDDYYTLLFDFYGHYEAENNTGLSNGDKVVVKFTKEADTPFEEAEISIDEGSFTYTVEGLSDELIVAANATNDNNVSAQTDKPTPKEISYDPFKGLSVTYSGISPDVTPTIDTSGCDEFVKQHVSFRPNVYNGLSNGDSVTVEAILLLKQDFEKNEEYTLTASSKDFTVDGMPFYIQDPAGYDWTEIDNAMLEKAKSAIEEQFPNGKSTVESMVKPGGNAALFCTVDKTEVVPSENAYIYFNGTGSGYNLYVDSTNARLRVYSCNITYTMEGATKQATRYVTVYVENIIDDGKGTMNVSDITYGSTVHVGFGFNDMDLTGIEQYWGEELSGYSGIKE